VRITAKKVAEACLPTECFRPIAEIGNAGFGIR